MPQTNPSLKSVPSRREQFRAALVLVEISVLLLALVAQKLQPPPMQEITVYVDRDVVFAASRDGTWQRALMPLYPGCVLHWDEGTGAQAANLPERDIPLDARSWQAVDRLVVFRVQAQTMDFQPGHPQGTLLIDGSEIALWSECPPEPAQMAVYALDGELVMVETATRIVTPLMPLRNNLLWSGHSSVVMTIATLPALMEEPDSAWLPEGAELVGMFTTLTPVELITLDKYHVMLRTSDEDIVLLSD
jgi:hypothetical protein